MSKKLQVFISSTYEDLKEERQQAIQTILRLGHIPAGMEFFGQDDRNQWDLIKEWLKISDVVILIIKDRYGTICNETGKSYTQMEYEFALKENKKIIKIVFENKNKNDEQLLRFRGTVLHNNTVTSIYNTAEMAERITKKLIEYTYEITDGWIRTDDVFYKNYENKYKLIQFLMFAEDYNTGFNRFNVLPKVLMLLDMKKEYNPVEINHLIVNHYIIAKTRYGENVYDCKRQWILNDIRNIGNEPLSTYKFFTTTDIGKHQDAIVTLHRCINEAEYNLDNGNSYRNNGISCWNWVIRPSVAPGEYIDDMCLTENVEKAWDFYRSDVKEERQQEIIYFIPKSFGEIINRVTFLINVIGTSKVFDMELFEIFNEGNKFNRRSRGQLLFNLKGDSGVYGIELNEFDMDNLYYIVVRKKIRVAATYYNY